jgi:cell migration-inducing and hyaluronan-binding protein
LSFAAVVIVAVVAALTSTGLPSPASAATSQLWSDRATWGGDVPDAGDTVVVPSGKTIVLDVSPPKLAGVQVDGTLRFANRNLRLHTGWIMVHGRLQVGTAAAPYTRNAEIILDGDPNANIMGMGASVLGVMAGGQLELHGQPRPVRWSRLTRIAVAGSNVLHVGATKGWHAGDDIVIASTDLDPTHAEQRRVTRVDGGRVTLSAPLNHTHWGVVDDIGGRRIAQRAEVGLLSRNIVIRGGASSASTLIGGHVMVMAGSTARVSDVEFTHMGQSGRLARYPFHFHMNGSNPTSSITSSVMHHTFNRCVTVHGTSDVTVADNVGYHALGHCFFFEDGAERGVKLLRNLGVETLRPPADRRILDTDSVPASFWIQHPNNIVRGNAAAGSEGNGFWYDLPEHPTGLSATNAYSPREGAFGEFSNNVAHSNNNASGQFRSGSGLLVEDYEPPGPATFSGLTSYKNSGFGVWADGVTVANATLAENNVGFLGRGSALRDSVVVGSTSNNADKHWSMTGVGLYHDMAWVRHVTFANFKPDEWRHGVAVGPIVEDITEVPRFSAVRFVNADRVRMTPPWIEDRVAATVLEDLDGTLTGTGHPSAITASHPLLLDGGCQARASIGAHLCDPGRGITMMRVQDQTGNNAPLGPTVVRRADGAQAQIASDPGWADNPQSQGTLLMDRRYRVDLGRATPGDLEWVVSGASRGWVQLAVDWPHASAFAYEGWGEWANTLQPAGGEAGLADGDRYWLDSATGRLHVRFTNDGHLRWQRIKVCATRYCGEGLGSRTS